MVPCCVSDVRLASVTRGTVFRDAEVHQLGSGARQHDVRGLHVPVHDSVAMRVIERIGHLDRALKRAIKRQRRFREACREGIPLEYSITMKSTPSREPTSYSVQMCG